MRLAISSAVTILLQFLLLMATPAAADTSNCPRPDNIITALERNFPEIKLTRMRGEEARRFVEAFNGSSSQPPVSADEVLIAGSPKTPDQASVGFFKNGCLLALVPLSLANGGKEI
jgi:hypothetical protein